MLHTYTIEDGQYVFHAESTDAVDTFYGGKKGRALVVTSVKRRSPSVFLAYTMVGDDPLLLTHGTETQIRDWVKAHPEGRSGGHEILIHEATCPVDTLNAVIDGDAAILAELVK